MRKIMFGIALVLAFIFLQGVYNSTAQEMIPKTEGMSQVGNLSGATVKNPKGEYLGSIIDLVTGPEGGASFAILAYWISDDTQQRVAVPFGALSCKERSCVLHASKDMLEAAPVYVSDDYLMEPKLAGEIYRYFGLQPYWTEENTDK